MKTLTKEIKLKVLNEALERIKQDVNYNICEQLRLLTEQETGEKYYTVSIQEKYKLNQFRPEGAVGMDGWWPLNEEGQAARQKAIEKLIKDLENEG